VYSGLHYIWFVTREVREFRRRTGDSLP